MQLRRSLALIALAALVVSGCSSDGDSDGATKSAEIPNQPAGMEGQEFCAQFSEQFIVEAIDKPYRTYDAVPLKDFPAPGVNGYECQWEWLNPSGDERNLKVDVLDFDGALEGSIDASWKDSVELLGPLAKPVDELGDDAVSAKLQGLVTVSTREGLRQVTIVGGSKGSVPPPSVEAMSLIGMEALTIGK